MSIAGLAIALVAALGGLAVVLNHCYARLALVELALNEGLPPGYEAQPLMGSATRSDQPQLDPALALPAGVSIFLSRNCHACQRLIDELDQVDINISADIHLRYVDRPRPIAAAAADRQSAQLHEHQQELTTQLAADPLPYTIAVGDHSLVSRSVTPTLDLVLTTARNAGIMAQR